MKSRLACFTLIELMVVVAILAIIAAIALPGLVGARVTANEQSAIGTLAAVRSAQQIFKARRHVDLDTDGDGEFGFLQEICGAVLPRGKNERVRTGEILHPVLGQTAGGVAIKGGYCFRIFLPSNELTGGGPIPETDGAAAAVLGDANAQEARWICYAWPTSKDRTGNRAFVVNQTNVIYESDNEAPTQQYDGPTAGPVTGSEALEPGTTDLEGRFLIGGAPATDGGIWVPVSG